MQHSQRQIALLERSLDLHRKTLAREWRRLHQDLRAGVNLPAGPLKAFFKYRVQFEYSKDLKLRKVREHAELLVR